MGADKDESLPYLTPDDVIGVVQRGLGVIMHHLNQPYTQVHGPACVAELERLMTFMSKIPAPIQAGANGNTQPEKRAN